MIGRKALVFEDEDTPSFKTYQMPQLNVASTLLDVLNPAKAICSFIIEHNRTKQIEKQIAAQKKALDAAVAEEMKRIDIKYSEYLKRLEEKSKVLEASLNVKVEQNRVSLEKQEIKMEETIAIEKIRMNNAIYMSKFSNEQMSLLREIINEVMKDGFTWSKYFQELSEKYREALRMLNKANKSVL